MVEEVLNTDPFSSHLFVSCHRLRDKIKIFYWYNNGFWLLYRRLGKPRFWWPASGERVAVKIDGSPHAWFEGRGPRGTLIVVIDEATSRLMAPRFVPTETTRAYLQTRNGYLEHPGRPGALYSDKHRIFQINLPDHRGELTPVTRALKTAGYRAHPRPLPSGQRPGSGLSKRFRIAGSKNYAGAPSPTSIRPMPPYPRSSPPTTPASLSSRTATTMPTARYGIAPRNLP